MRQKNLLAKVKFQAWLWIHFKLALLVWSVLLYHFTPPQVQDTQGSFLTGLMTIVTGIGAVIAIVGLIVKNQGGEITLVGTEIELGGLFFMAAGPVTYLFTQISLALNLPNGEGETRYALCAFAYALCAALLARIAIVFDHFRKQTRDPKVTV